MEQRSDHPLEQFPPSAVQGHVAVWSFGSTHLIETEEPRDGYEVWLLVDAKFGTAPSARIAHSVKWCLDVVVQPHLWHVADLSLTNTDDSISLVVDECDIEFDGGHCRRTFWDALYVCQDGGVLSDWSPCLAIDVTTAGMMEIWGPAMRPVSRSDIRAHPDVRAYDGVVPFEFIHPTELNSVVDALIRQHGEPCPPGDQVRSQTSARSSTSA